MRKILKEKTRITIRMVVVGLVPREPTATHWGCALPILNHVILSLGLEGVRLAKSREQTIDAYPLSVLPCYQLEMDTG